MIVCFTIAGVRHCFQVPILEWPIHFWKGPGPGNYDKLLQDGILVSSMQRAAGNISDSGVRAAVQHGIAAGFKVMQQRAGEGVSIEAE
jgi:hypothetical protein